MNVEHCPECGSDDIETNSGSFEYGGYCRWTCDDCGWTYKSGSGIGTGTSNEGTHPRSTGPSDDQSTLVQTGQWCSMCKTRAKPGYCRCVGDDQIGFCKDCAKYSEHDADDMLPVQTYFGRHKESPFDCSICEDQKAELKILDD